MVLMTEPFPIIVLSHFQAAPLLKAHREGKPSATTSTDLGLTTLEASLTPEGVIYPSGETCTWADLEKVAKSDNKCFFLGDAGRIEPIQVFSETTNWVRTLYATQGAPTTIVAGLSMHRIKGIDPHADTLLKVKTIAPLTGRVLDTATGLGYTAIEAAKQAAQVVTIELDPAA